MATTKRAVLVGGIAVAVVVGLGAAIGLGALHTSPPLTPAERAAIAARRLLAAETKVVKATTPAIAVTLPATAGAPAPQAGSSPFTGSIPAHEVFGYVPYWTMANLTPADFSSASDLAYYGLELTASGAVRRSGPGYTDFVAPGFASFVASAHGAGDRVLLTVSTTDRAVIDHLTSSPEASAARLVAVLLPLLVANHLDGVDLDIEGRGASGRSGFVAFVAAVRRDLLRVEPSSELVINTYPQSAAGSEDFFDVHRLARFVDRIFIMGYAMNDNRFSGAGAPLASPVVGWSDVQALLQYAKVAPANKVLLGSPFYGVDYATLGPWPGSPATSAYPLAVTYDAINGVGRKALWDPSSFTVWTRFKRTGHWHQTWYENPVSIALKTALAAHYRIAGVGAWAFGMEGADTAMLNALVGTSPPLKLPLTPAN